MTTNKVYSHKYSDYFTFFLRCNKAPLSNYPIYLGYSPKEKTEYIYFNCEQMTRKYALNHLKSLIITSKPVEIWDYSLKNIEILKEHGITAKYVKVYPSDEYLERVKLWIKQIPEYDVGFCGELSGRRNTILDNIKKLGITVNIVKKWGDERDKELAKCRIIINIHYDKDYNIFETARCEPWLTLGIPVVSEISLDNDDRCINVPYNNMVDEVCKIIKTYRTL